MSTRWSTSSTSAVSATRRSTTALDFIAFFHKPHYVVVEVAPLVPTRTEPGRAPASAEIDETRQSQYVYMVRDLGARRQPAMVLMVGSTIILLTCAWLLHRRDALVERNTEVARRQRADAMDQYLPIVVLAVLGVVFVVLSRWRLDVARPAPSVGGQGGAVRVRHRAQP